MKTENHYTETDLGNISLNPRGEYDPEAFYEYLDTVSMDGGSYMCLAELGTKITGTPPVPGINTEHWQILTLPGGLTPEYITMHDEVIEKAKQVEVSRAAVELSQSEIEAMQADVAQLHKDTQDSAQSALASKNQAAGYASAADTSRQAAERAKQDVDAQIPNIDAKLQAALNEIDTTRQSANTSVKKQEELSVQTVKDQTGTYITEQKNLAKQELDEKVNDFGLNVDAIKKQVSDEGAKQVEATRTAGNTAVQEIGTVKSTAVQEVQTEGTVQTEKVSAKGTEQVQAVADTGAQQVQLVKTEGQKQLTDVQQAAQEIVADREQIQENKAEIEGLKQGKADAIVETASGEDIRIEDSSGLGFEGLRIFGKSTQDGVPSPESPVPIVNVGDKGTIEVGVTGTNLFDVSKIEDTWNGSYGIKNNNGVLTMVAPPNDSSISSNKTLKELCPQLKVGETYILDVINSGKAHRIYLASVKKMWEYRTSMVMTDEMLNSVVRFYISANANDSGIIHNIQVNKGDTVLPYEPYREPQSLTITTPNGLPGVKVDSDGNYTDSNGQQWICDEIDLERGKYVQRIKKIIFDGRQDFDDEINTNANRRRFGHIVEKLSRSTDNIISTHFRTMAYGYNEPSGNNTISFNSANNTIMISSDKFASLKEFKNWLNENNVIVVYALETPIEHDLTPEEIAAYKSLHTNYPTTVISNDESAHMEVSYVADTKNYIVSKIETPLQKQITDLQNALINQKISGGGYKSN